MKNLIFLLLVLSTYAINAQDNKNIKNYIKINYPNGKISSEGYMFNNKPDGFWKTYYVNGILKSEGNRKNHLLDSIWVFYNELGDTTEKISYLMGKRNGYYYKYSTVEQKNSGKKNVIISKEMFVNDKKEGLSYYYYPEGSIHEIINYKNDRRNGTGKEFDKTGVIITIYEFFNNYITDKQNINRESNGQKIGVWKDFYEDGKVKSEKIYQNDLLSGYAKDFDKTGKITLNILYKEGKIVDLPKSDTLDIDEKIEYGTSGFVKIRGYFRKGVPVGIHREYNENGDVIDSYIYNENGKVVSKGIVKDDGSKEGNWTYFYDDGSKKSEGVYVKNRQNGEWKFLFPNGVNEQIGIFKNGVLNGEWQWFYKNGKNLRKENFKNGKREGSFIEFNSSGDSLQIGNYVDGEMDGEWKVFSGDIFEVGNYSGGLKEGLWKEYYKNGVLAFEGNFLGGNPDGKHSFYYQNGKLREEQFYVNGAKEKVWKKFSDEGLLLLSITYENDSEVKINGIKVEIAKRN